MITVQITRHAVSGHAELLRKPHPFMAASAGVARKVLLRDRRVRVCVRLDRVDSVAVRADRSLPITSRQRLPMNTLDECLLDRRVALSAGRRNIEFVYRRLNILGGKYLVRAMTIAANRGCF